MVDSDHLIVGGQHHEDEFQLRSPIPLLLPLRLQQQSDSVAEHVRSSLLHSVHFRVLHFGVPVLEKELSRNSVGAFALPSAQFLL